MRASGWLVGAGALAAGLAVLAVGLELSGYDSPAALGALWSGAFGSWYALTSATLVRAVPLIVIGLGLALAFRAGVFNIGGEGQFYAGAIAATWIGLQVGGLPWPLAVAVALSASLLAGALWVAIPVLLRLRYGVLEVISTLLLNFVAEATDQPDGAGAAAGESAHLSPERCDRRERAAAGPARDAAACGAAARARRRCVLHGAL